MRVLWLVGVLISLVPLVTLGIFNGLTIVGLIIVAVATIRIIRKDGLA
jgi:hypothetical protein